MSRILVKREDGLYAIWSTVVDDFIVDEATKEEVFEVYKEWALEEAIKETEKIGRAHV